MKKAISIILFMLITVWVNAQTDKIKKCEYYAKESVHQNSENISKKYGLKGPAWSSDYNYHKNWCLHGENFLRADKELSEREKRLQALSKYKFNATTHAVIKNAVKDQPKFEIITPAVVVKTPNVNVVPSVKTIPFNTDAIHLTSSEKFKVGRKLKKGSTVYSDRNFLYWDIPAKLKGLDYLITRNADKFTSGDQLFTIEDPRELTVYIAIDPRITPPSWMIKNYENTYEIIKFKIPDNGMVLSFNIYKKDYKEGMKTIVFGGNQNTQNQKQCGMYLVFFSEKVQTVIDLKNKFKGSTVNGIGIIKVTKNDAADYVSDSKKGEKNKKEDIKNNKICSTEIRSLKGNNSSLFLLNDQRDSDLFPGNILNVSKIEAGDYTGAKTPERKPYKISTNMIGNVHPTVTVANATLGDYRVAKASLLKFDNKIGPRFEVGEYKSVESAVDFAVKTSGSFRYYIYSGNASASFQETTKKNHYETTIDKIYYSIDFKPKQNDFFKDPNIPDNNDWVYVSNVQYGTKLILDIKSDYSKEDVQAALNFEANAGVISGGGEASFSYKEILKNTDIKVIALGEMSGMGIKNLINDPKDPKNFAYVFSNSKITDRTQLYPLSYTLKFVDDNKTAKIETFAKYTQQKCRKISNILSFEFHDIYVVQSDDSSNGEDLYGWMKIKPWAYSEKEVFNQSFEENKEGGESPILLKPNKIYYYKYSHNGLSDPKKNFEIEAHIKEYDSTSADDDFGHTLIRIPLNEIFSGAIYEDQNLKKYGLAVPNKWKSISTLNDNKCDECLVMPFSHDDSKVLVRFKINLPDKLPAGVNFTN